MEDFLGHDHKVMTLLMVLIKEASIQEYFQRKLSWRSSIKSQNHSYIYLFPLPRFAKWKSLFPTKVLFTSGKNERKIFIIHYILLDHSTLILVINTMFCSGLLNILEFYWIRRLDYQKTVNIQVSVVPNCICN